MTHSTNFVISSSLASRQRVSLAADRDGHTRMSTIRTTALLAQTSDLDCYSAVTRSSPIWRPLRREDLLPAYGRAASSVRRNGSDVR